MTYYSRTIEMPKSRKEGLCNYVQMIINRLEAGEAHEALMTAVGLLDDLSGSVYADAIDPSAGQPATILLSEHDAQLRAAKSAAFDKGFSAGAKAKAAEISKALADA